MRLLLRALRWGLTALALAAWLTRETWQAALFTLLIGLLVVFFHRLPSRHQLPWERLIEEEARTRKRYYHFFGLFIDVPDVATGSTKRSYLSWLLRIVPYSKRNTYTYLYTASLLRTEIGGIIIRLLLLGSLVSYWSSEAASFSGWGAVFTYVIFLTVISVQLGGLRHVNRYSVWKHVYPLPKKMRMDNYLKVDRIGMLTSSLLLWLFAGLPLVLLGVYIPALICAAFAFLLIVTRPSRVKRKMKREEDEE